MLCILKILFTSSIYRVFGYTLTYLVHILVLPSRLEVEMSLLRQSMENIFTNPRDMKKRYFEIPFDTNKRFVERPQILHSLEYAMGLTGDVRRGKERVVLTGMGSSGKTELAIRFAELHRDDFWAIFWLDASRKAQLTNGLNLIANTLSGDCSVELDMALSYCQQWFTGQKEWLLIVDNLDDDEMIEAFRTAFLKAGIDGSILITSRNTSLSTFWGVIQVGDLAMQEGRELLKQIIGTKMLSQESEPDQTAEMDIEDVADGCRERTMGNLVRDEGAIEVRWRCNGFTYF
jgi:hypothetical protein